MKNLNQHQYRVLAESIYSKLSMCIFDIIPEKKNFVKSKMRNSQKMVGQVLIEQAFS